MARFEEILVVTKELAIPDGVRIIIAEYAELTDEERTLYLLHRNNGQVCRTCNRNGYKRVLNIHTSTHGGEDTIAVWDGLRNKYDRHYTTQAMTRKLRTRFWTSNTDGRRAHKLASLWQQIYDLWIAL